MLHSDALVLAQLPEMPLEERYNCLFKAVDDVLGDQGTLVLPTFSYSFTKGEDFDVQKTPSDVGSITEYFWHQPNVKRSLHPIFSIAAKGKHTEEFVNSTLEDCFGDKSTFHQLIEKNAWIACLGCSFDRITLVHYVEQKLGVDYRYMKKFSGKIYDDTDVKEITTQYYVRDIARETQVDLSTLKEHLTQKGLLKISKIGRVLLTMVRAKDFLEQAELLLKDRSNILIREGQI